MLTPKKVAKLWILWKTQDSRAPSLWITSSARLLTEGASARIGGVPEGCPEGSPHLENTLSDGRSIFAARAAPVASRSFPHVDSRAGGIVVPYPQERTAEGVAESPEAVRYTHYLAFRLHRTPHLPGGYPQMWKTLWTSRQNRRSQGFGTFRCGEGATHGYGH
jgi:hypothetical protein